MKVINRNCQENGITLIALVVTIVVLLILAAVSIGMLTGENGLITRAQEASEETRGASVEEERDLWKANQALDEYTSASSESLPELINRLVNQGLLKENEKDQILGNEEKGIEATGQVTIGSRTIVFGTAGKTLVDMFRKAESDGCTNEDGTCDNLEHLHIGDYVNYQNPTTGKYTITGDKTGVDANQTYSIANNQLNWRVLGIDEETGGLKLITGSPMKLDNISGKDDPYLYMYGARAYLYGTQEIDKACEMYKNSYAVKARSVKIDDINELAGIEEEDISTYNFEPILNPDIAPYGSSYSYSGYTPEGWIRGDGQTTVAGEAKGYVYLASENTSGLPDGVNAITMPSTRARKMLFDNLSYRQGKDYWLASSGVFSFPSDGYAFFAPYAVGELEGLAMAGFSSYCGFFSDGNERGGLYSVRPVVILQSDITKDQISKIADKTEETWNYNGGEWDVDFYNPEN